MFVLIFYLALLVLWKTRFAHYNEMKSTGHRVSDPDFNSFIPIIVIKRSGLVRYCIVTYTLSYFSRIAEFVFMLIKQNQTKIQKTTITKLFHWKWYSDSNENIQRINDCEQENVHELCNSIFIEYFHWQFH